MKQPVLLTTYIEQLLMAIVDPIMILFLVERRHQVSQHVLPLVGLMDLGVAVKAEPNTEQEHALEQTVQHIHKHSLKVAVHQLADHGVLGKR